MQVPQVGVCMGPSDKEPKRVESACAASGELLGCPPPLHHSHPFPDLWGRGVAGRGLSCTSPPCDPVTCDPATLRGSQGPAPLSGWPAPFSFLWSGGAHFIVGGQAVTAWGGGTRGRCPAWAFDAVSKQPMEPAPGCASSGFLFSMRDNKRFLLPSAFELANWVSL